MLVCAHALPSFVGDGKGETVRQHLASRRGVRWVTGSVPCRCGYTAQCGASVRECATGGCGARKDGAVQASVCVPGGPLLPGHLAARSKVMSPGSTSAVRVSKGTATRSLLRQPLNSAATARDATCGEFRSDSTSGCVTGQSHPRSRNRQLDPPSATAPRTCLRHLRCSLRHSH